MLKSESSYAARTYRSPWSKICSLSKGCSGKNAETVQKFAASHCRVLEVISKAAKKGPYTAACRRMLSMYVQRKHFNTSCDVAARPPQSGVQVVEWAGAMRTSAEVGAINSEMVWTLSAIAAW